MTPTVPGLGLSIPGILAVRAGDAAPLAPNSEH